MSTPNLGILAGELEELSQFQHDYEKKIEDINSEVIRLKRADESKTNVIAELQLKLLASTHEKNIVREVNMKLSSNILHLQAKLDEVENDRNEVRQNMKQIKELMDQYIGKNEIEKKAPELS